MTINTGFRAWYYFRMGWSTYFAFIFAAINTYTVTYYLTIERIPSLKEVFPNFFSYVGITSIIGIPILVLVGYAHYKRTKAFKSEVDILLESNPYVSRVLANSEMLLTLNLELNKIIIKLAKKEEITKNEADELFKLQEQISKLIDERTFHSKHDLDFLRKTRGL